MNLSDYTKEHILGDLRKLQYLYGLKKVIRYAQDRHEEDSTESVAEHIYGMHILAQYFLPLENPEGSWDKSRIYEMITIHDADEIETGDVLGYTKTDEIRAQELDSMKITISKAPKHIQADFTALAEEYEAKETIEARFARAIDKIEPLVHIYNEEGRQILAKNKTTADQTWRIKEPYIGEFPFIKVFAEVVHNDMIRAGYFYDEPENLEN